MVGSRGFEPRSARSGRAASADCATSRRCGDHGRIRTATGQALDLLPLPGWATWPLVPSDGLEPPPHGLRTRRAPFTLRREVAVGANGGTRTRTSRLGRPAGNRYPTFALVRPRYQALIPRPNSDRWRSPAHRLLSVVKDPALASWWAARDSNPIAPLGENGFTARQRTIRSYRPFWRQRQDSNPDPRGLEARMLPLHHAVVVASHLDRFRDKTSL
jgi:hypothetical protein